ncbi:Tpn1 protein [Pichia kluyveri]|uniref:Tpn1 protein n=1 Tax=Pichia kluyveri TaxID=36015 RepID=A0AAV5R466_PICKL|nr:Tpn1 protein [Pichia kluyveri]
MNGIVKYYQKTSNFIDSLGVESKGIHRYLPNERYNENSVKPYISTLGLWISGCGGLTSMSSYFLGPLIYQLGLKDAMLIGNFGTLVGCLVAAYCATMGPRSGLRQMCSARYLFGPWMVRVVSIITIIGFLGWSITNNVLGGEIIKWLSNGKLNLSVGIIIVSIISLIVALFGIEYVLKFEGIIGVFVLIVVLLLYIISSGKFTKWEGLQTTGVNSLTKIGNRISFFTLAYSVTATWGGCASDYYIVFPENISQIKLFNFTFLGILLPTLFGANVGILIGNAAVGFDYWNEIYENESLGGLLNVVFDKWGNFGKFLLVVFWLSLITNNIINTYSSALSVQLLDDLCYRYLSRWIIVVIIFVITLVCSLVGKNHFSEILSNFLPMLGYWISIYFTLLIEENLIFRSTSLVKLFKKELYEVPEFEKNEVDDEENILPTLGSTLTTNYKEDVEINDNETSNSSIDNNNNNSSIPPFSTVNSIPYYNFEAWNDKYILTNGIAATFGFCCGVAGAIVGMNQVYYKGPIANLVGDDGADIGMFLSIGFTAISYPLARYWELKCFQK